MTICVVCFEIDTVHFNTLSSLFVCTNTKVSNKGNLRAARRDLEWEPEPPPEWEPEPPPCHWGGQTYPAGEELECK